jgi:hypothetical protein
MKLSAKHVVGILIGLSVVFAVERNVSSHYSRLAFRDAKHCSEFGFCYNLSDAACVQCSKLNTANLQHARWRLVQRIAANDRLVIDDRSMIELVSGGTGAVVSTPCGELLPVQAVSLGLISIPLPVSPQDTVCPSNGESSALQWPSLQFSAAVNATTLQLTGADAIYIFEKVPVDMTVIDESRTFIVLFKPEVNQGDIERFMAVHQLTPINVYDMGASFRGVAVNLSPSTLEAVRNDPRVSMVEQDQEFRLDMKSPAINNDGKSP